MFVTPPQQPHQTDNAAATRRPNAERGDGHNSQTQTPADLFLAGNCEAAGHEDRIHESTLFECVATESTLFECVATESTVLFLDDHCFATVTINPQSNKSNKSNRKQKATESNRKQQKATENRKQKTENRKQKTENRKQKTENRKRKLESWKVAKLAKLAKLESCKVTLRADATTHTPSLTHSLTHSLFQLSTRPLPLPLTLTLQLRVRILNQIHIFQYL